MSGASTTRSPIARIRVPARWEAAEGLRSEPALFELGPGPCGRTVTALEARFGTGVLIIRQRHAEGGPMVFAYPLHQLTGRVEIEHA